MFDGLNCWVAAVFLLLLLPSTDLVLSSGCHEWSISMSSFNRSCNEHFTWWHCHILRVIAEAPTRRNTLKFYCSPTSGWTQSSLPPWVWFFSVFSLSWFSIHLTSFGCPVPDLTSSYQHFFLSTLPHINSGAWVTFLLEARKQLKAQAWLWLGSKPRTLA